MLHKGWPAGVPKGRGNLGYQSVCSRLLQQTTLRQDYVYIGDLGPAVTGLVALMTFPCAGVLPHTAGLEPRNPGFEAVCLCPCSAFVLVVSPSSV